MTEKVKVVAKNSKKETNGRKRVLIGGSVILLAFLIHKIFYPNSSPVVDTKNGKVQGYVAYSRLGKEYYSYIGLPFAQTPPPIAPKSWDGVRSATSYGSQCMQIDLITSLRVGSENCLFLNVHVPKHAKDSGKLLPVLFWIHGGGFQSGSSQIYRPNYFMDEEIIFVSINYRLGALGFLNTGDGLVRGNQGMKDLIQGLKWVQENIKNFNGNPDSVTIFGESAGGGAVHFLMLSPLSKGLFHRAISQSGNVLNTWLYSRYPKEQSQSLAKRLNCPTERPEDMVKCLKEIDATQIVDTHKEMRLPPRPLLGKYAPSVESVVDETTFLPDQPIEMLKKGKFAHIPWMTGVDSEEGLPFSTEILEEQSLIDWANRDFDDFLTQVVFLMVAPKRAKNTTQLLKEYYFSNSSTIDKVKSFKGLSELHGARFFFVSGHHTAKYHSKHAPVWIYYYDYPTEFGFLKLMHSLRGKYLPVIETVLEVIWHWTQKILGLKIHRRGSSHGEEMLLQFSFPFIPGAEVGTSDFEISKELVKTWVQFATDPSKLGFQHHKWPPQDPKETKLKYMEIATNSRGMIDEPFNDQVKLWDSLNII